MIGSEQPQSNSQRLGNEGYVYRPLYPPPIYNDREADNIYSISNEASFHEVCDMMGKLKWKGAVVGVGADQLLDLVSMGDFESAYIVDITPSVVATNLAFLELGKIHHTLHNKYPSVKEFISYFEESNIEASIKLLASHSSYPFSAEQLDLIQLDMRRLLWPSAKRWQPNKEAPLKFAGYFDFKMKNRRNSWLGSDEKLAHIIDMYEQDAIHVIESDITNQETMEKIAHDIKNKNQVVSMVYVSNAPERFNQKTTSLSYGAFNKEASEERLEQSIFTLPVTDQTIIFETFTGNQGGPVNRAKSIDVQSNLNIFLTSADFCYALQTLEDQRKYGWLSYYNSFNGYYKADGGGKERKNMSLGQGIFISGESLYEKFSPYKEELRKQDRERLNKIEKYVRGGRKANPYDFMDDVNGV